MSASVGGVPTGTVGSSVEARGGGCCDGRGNGSEGGAGGRGAGQGEEGALCRAVKFRCAGVSGYGFRREPAKECLSTLESVAYTLEVRFSHETMREVSRVSLLCYPVSEPAFIDWPKETLQSQRVRVNLALVRVLSLSP